MARFRSALALCAVMGIGCSTPEAPSGILTGHWSWHGPDSSTNYFTLALSQTGGQALGHMQFCRINVCGGVNLSSPYADSSFSFPLGQFVIDSQFVSASLKGRIKSVDTLSTVLTNYWQLSTDTLVFVRAGVSAVAP